MAGALALLVVQTVVLRFLRVPLGLQAAALFTGAWATAAGWAFLHRLTAGVEDLSARLALWFLTGMIALTGVSFVLFHQPVARSLGLDGLGAATRLSLTVVGLAAIPLAGAGRATRPAPAARGRNGGLALAVLALGMSAATIYGVANRPADPFPEEILEAVDEGHPLAGSTLPEWGERGDFQYHLVKLPWQIAQDGLPLHPVEHAALQVWALSASTAFDGYEAPDAVQAAKVLSVPIWFSVLALGQFIARRVLGLGRLGSWATVLGIALFAPINYPWFGTAHSSYLAFITAAGAMYHNAPQLYTVALGMGALALLGAGQTGRVPFGPAFVTAASLTAASFWFKPSLFVVMGPALLAAGLIARRGGKRALGLGAAILFLPILFWGLYPRLLGAPTLPLEWRVDPWAFYFTRTAHRFPAWLSSNGVYLAAAILLLSFGAWVIPLAAWLGRCAGALRRQAAAAWRAVRESPMAVTTLVAGLLGLAMALLLIEKGGRAAHGNFTWSLSAAYVLALPLLVRLAADLRHRAARWVVAVLFLIHLAAGGLHLWLFVTADRL